MVDCSKQEDCPRYLTVLRQAVENYRLMAWRYCCRVTYCPPVSATSVLVGDELANDGHVITSVKTAVES